VKDVNTHEIEPGAESSRKAHPGFAVSVASRGTREEVVGIAAHLADGGIL
jgi:hypothetical protein